MTLAPETQLIETSSDGTTHTYTAARGGRRWTIRIADAELAKLPKLQKRMLLAKRIGEAMRGPADTA